MNQTAILNYGMGWDGMGRCQIFWGPALDIWRGGQWVYLRGGSDDE